MIDPKELRIGNWVHETVLGDCLVDGIRAMCANVHKPDNQHSHYTINGENLFPIPLTPEILEKCGFENNGFYRSHSDPYMEISPSATGFILSVNGSEYEIGETFNHLHQLQNLYFALTKAELNYQP